MTFDIDILHFRKIAIIMLLSIQITTSPSRNFILFCFSIEVLLRYQKISVCVLKESSCNETCKLHEFTSNTDAVQADKQYHQEFNPPPEGSATGIGKEEKVIPIEDASHDQEQIQQR